MNRFVSSVPCWTCGARIGELCRTASGRETHQHHISRYWMMMALDENSGSFNGGHCPFTDRRISDERAYRDGVLRPEIHEEIAREFIQDDNPGEMEGIQPGMTYYHWQPLGCRVIRSKIRPVRGENGIIFWP